MKSIFKFMTVALAAGLAVSCSDDLNLEQKATLHAEKGDLVGTLYSEVPTRVAVLDEWDGDGYPTVWSDDDKVNVFSSKRLNFNQYTLKEGAGTNQAVFEPVEEDPSLLASTDLYAITEASYQYGVSAIDANSGKVLLTAEIPTKFDWKKVCNDEGDEINAYKLPSPYWGNASFGSDGILNVGFRPLTAVLRLDLAQLPEDVQAIVLVSGNSMFPGATYTVNGTQYSGTGEGISGHFNAVLDYQSADRPALGIDRALVCEDTLRVDLPEEIRGQQDMVLYLPLIAQHYDELRVIAVMDDSVNPYEWGGEILKEFNDQEIVNGKTYNLAQTAEVEITATSPLAISEQIAAMYDGKHALVVSLPNIEPTSDDNTIYIVSDEKGMVGNTDITINFPGAADDIISGGLSESIPELNIVEVSANNKIGADFIRFNMGTKKVADFEAMKLGGDPNVESGDKQRKVTLNFDEAIDKVNITLPTSNVIMSAGMGLEEVNIFTSNTNNVSGWDANSIGMESNEQNAALKFKGTYGTVNYWSGGAVYFLDEESEIYESLNIFGSNPYSLRITDALVNEIAFPTLGTNPTTYIYTTGSAAIKHLNENGNKVKIKAYWTGKRLTRYAVANGYEGSKVYDAYYGINSETAGVIYTAAQLQGMGMAMNKYAYTISPKVESIWLGGIDWPWIGAEIEDLSGDSWYNDSEDAASDSQQNSTELWQYTYKKGTGEKIEKAFSLDGRNVELKNMILDIYDPDIVLPGCCGTTQKVRLLQNLGLIRSIRTTETVDIYNIQLDDVLLDTHDYAIDNVGSLVGIIDAEKNVTIGGKKDDVTCSNFTDIRIISKGNNIGGVIGELECAAAVTIDKVKVESVENNDINEGKESYIHGGHIQGKNNVGGIVGRVTYDEAYKGVDPQFANPQMKDVEDLPQELKKGADDTDKWVTSKKGTVKKTDYPVSNIYTRSVDTEALAEGTLKYKYAPVGTNPFPAANVDYFFLDEDNLAMVELGTVKEGEDLSSVYTASTDPRTTPAKTVKSSDTENFDWTKVMIETTATDASTRTFESAGFTADSHDMAADKTYFYDFETTHKEVDEEQSIDNDYPLALTISNATVTLTPRSEKGIILGEKGNNVGGLVGDVVINGPANAHKAINVTVPTISATTKEIANKVNQAETKFGNNVGGLIGDFYNVSEYEKDAYNNSNFGGNIKCELGITGDGQNVGGVLGIQTVETTGSTNEVNQVTIGNLASCSVEVGELRATNGWGGGLVGNQNEGSLLVNGNAKTTVKVDIKTALKGANCMGGMVGENTAVTIISNEGKNSVNIADAALTKEAAFYVRTPDNQPNTSGSMYLGTFGTLVGQKNASLTVAKTANLTVSPAGFEDSKKDELLFGLHKSAATTEISPNTKKFWGDSNKGYVGYAKMTANYVVDGHSVDPYDGDTQQGNYGFNIEKVY